MAIIPTVRCSNMERSLAFYTRVLGFQVIDGDSDLTDPSFCILSLDGDRLFLSSHRGDGAYGQAIVIQTDNVDATVATMRHRGLPPTNKSDSPVHTAPVNQTWGTREFYVDDPDGNTLRFIQR
jgi:catechol 2,3-dioxygenase-like lactoylglutathione lyase family enzyme